MTYADRKLVTSALLSFVLILALGITIFQLATTKTPPQVLGIFTNQPTNGQNK